MQGFILGIAVGSLVSIMILILYVHYQQQRLLTLQNYIKASDNYTEFLEKYANKLLNIIISKNDTDKDGKTDSSI
jgi:hypothetical protein